MTRINRYDTPAESNYFNTFVPLPLDPITALGMKRQEDLERKQDLFSRSVDDASMIDYVPGSVDEGRVKNEFLPQIQRLAEEAMSIDLSNPVEWAKYSTKIKRLSVSDDIKRIEQSAVAYKQALAVANEQRMRGVYNPLLDDTLKKAKSLDSRNEIFNYVPESQIDKSKLFEPYYKDIGQDYSVRVNVGTKENPLWVLRQGISDNKIRSIGAKAAQDLAATGGGNQIVRLARMENPALYADMTDREILESQMYEYGKSRADFKDQILPENMQGGSGSTKTIPESPYTTFPVPGQEYSLSEQDRLGLFEKAGIPDRSVGAAKRKIEKIYDKEAKAINKPISEWKPGDFVKALFKPFGAYKIAQAAYKELPSETREGVATGLEAIPEIITSFGDMQSVTPHNKALMYQLASTTKNVTDKVKAIIDPSYVNQVENLNKVVEDVRLHYPELTYDIIEQNGKSYRKDLKPEEILNNYVDVLNAGTQSDVVVYNIQDQTSWEETNDYAARTLMARSGEVGGPGVHKGMKPIEEQFKELGWKDISEAASIMADKSDNSIKLLGYGVDGTHPGTFAILAKDKNNKNGKGKIIYANADDVVSRNMGSAHILLNSAKLKQEVDVPWSDNKFIRLKYNVTSENGYRELAPRLELWQEDETGNPSPVLDKDGNIQLLNFDEIYRASLTMLSGTPTSPIVNDRGKVLNVGFRSNGQ